MTTFIYVLIYVLVIFLLLFVMASILSFRARRWLPSPLRNWSDRAGAWLRGLFVRQPSAAPVSVDDNVMNPDAFHTEFLKRADAFLQMQRKGFWSMERIFSLIIGLGAIVGLYLSAVAVMNYLHDRQFLGHYRSVGKEYFEKGDYRRAAAAYKEAVQLRPNDPELQCYFIGTSAFSGAQGREALDRAEVQCKLVMTYQLLDANGYNFVGVVYGRNGSYEDAEKAFKKATGLKDGIFDLAEYNLGKAYAEHAKTFGTQPQAESARRADYLQRALAVNKTLLGRNKTEVRALYNTSCDYALLGDASDAINTLKAALDGGYDRYQVIARDPDLDGIREDPRFRQLIKSRYAEVLGKYQGLLESAQTESDALHVLAWIELFSDDPVRIKEGVEYANRTLSRDPENPDYKATLAQLYAARGEYRSALVRIDEAINKEPSRYYYVRLRRSWEPKTGAR